MAHERILPQIAAEGYSAVPAGAVTAVPFYGTISSLIACYQTDELSSYHKLRSTSRTNYDGLLRRLRRDCGTERITDIKTRTLMTWHTRWSAGGKFAMAHSLMAMVRTLATYGAILLEDDPCKMLKVTLNGQRFQQGKPRTEFMRPEQADAIRAKANENGLHSIALAQAIQFDGTFRQKDIIGEWVPTNEPGVSDVLHPKSGKWLRGIRWSEVDENLILRHVTSKRQKEVVVDLKLAPMVIAELSRLHPDLLVTDEITKKVTVNRDLLPASGPVIIHEKTGRPFLTFQFRHLWRQIARAAGVPDRIFNMDSRSGAITEAIIAGVPLEIVRHAAAHSDIAMTQKYSRPGPEATAMSMTARAASRKTGAA